MLKINSNTDVVDNFQFLANMDYLKRVFVEKEDIERRLVPDRALVDGIEEFLLTYMNFYSNTVVDKITPTSLRHYLVDYEGVPAELFVTYSSKAKREVYTADKDTIEKIYNKGFAGFFLEYYLAYTELKTKVNNMESNYNKLRKTNYVSNSGRVLYYWPFFYKDSSTNRIYAKKCNMQNIPKKYTSGFTVPKDYFLIWGDFKQIDLRVALNICLADENDPVFLKFLHEVDDKYESVGRAVAEFRGEQFDMSKFKIDRDKYKESILSTIYGAQISTLVSTTKDREFSDTLFAFINNNPKYQSYKKTITDAISSGEPFECRSYFGYQRFLHPQTDRLLDSALNSPVQSTSGDIMKFFTNAVCSRMWKHVDKHKFFPYLNRHDENLFMVHKDCIPYLYELYDCLTIQVDDWTPLEIEWGVGYYYGVEDEALKKEVLAGMTSKPETIVGRTRRLRKYNPTDKIAFFTLVEYTHDGTTYRGLFDFDNMLGVFEAKSLRTREEFVHEVFENHLDSKLYALDITKVIVHCIDSDTMYVCRDRDVFLVSSTSDSYFYCHEVFNHLTTQYIYKHYGEVPENLRSRNSRKMVDGVEMVWLI